MVVIIGQVGQDRFGGTNAAGAADSSNANICQTRILTKGIEQLRDLREEVLRQRSQMRLPPEVNRALYVRNLPFKITSEEMYDIFGKFEIEARCLSELG